MGATIDPTAPFKMYYVAFRAFNSNIKCIRLGILRPYINVCRVNSNTLDTFVFPQFSEGWGYFY